MSLPRMRTAAGVLAILKDQDPGTEVALHYIRRLIKTGKVPVAHVGRKKLVDADKIIEYIAAGSDPQQTEPEPVMGEIRQVPV